MKVLWIIGTDITTDSFVEAGVKPSNSGGWNNTQLRRLYEADEVNCLTIISVRPKVYENTIEARGKLRVYHLSFPPVTAIINNRLINELYSIIVKEEPDIVDIQGTETTYSAITYLKSIPCPIIVTIHGVAFQCERFYTRGVPASTLLTNRSLADYLTLRGIYEKRLLMKRRASIEKKIIKSVNNVRGRTEWDRACILSINPSINYYKEELILRGEFGNYNWNIDTCEDHRIFATQANSPLKSIYTILETIKILKRKYQDIKLIIPGHPIKKGIKRNGYEKTIIKRIKRFDLTDNVFFTGNLDAAGMVKELLKARVFLLQSEIENSPNSLAEAQCVGVPCVASYTGGTPEYIENGKTGLLYNSFDPVMAAMQIEKLFDNDELCSKMSNEERIVARKRHN